MAVYLGSGGVPIVSKDRSTLGGIKTVAELGLNAMEVEFVRGVNMNKDMAKQVGEVAKEQGVRLSVHAPYFINLASEKKTIIKASIQRIFDSADRGELMGADNIAIHSAYYGNLTHEKTFEIVKQNFLEILDMMKQAGIKNVNIGMETMAKESQFGTLEEVLKMHKETKHVYPYIDFAHHFARRNGKIDYAEIFDKLKPFKLKHINGHFEGLKTNKEGKYVDIHAPIDNNPPFEPLAKEIVKRKLDITIISESPLLEQDSLKMKKILEKVGYKF